MNILFFLTPKSDVAYINQDDTVRQVLEKMEYHRYSSMPIINQKGEYIGTITEGDLLFAIKNHYYLNFRDAEKTPISQIARRSDNRPVRIDADIEDLLNMAMHQNFVPVIDDHRVFIGIVTRKDILQFCYNQMKKRNGKSRQEIIA